MPAVRLHHFRFQIYTEFQRLSFVVQRTHFFLQRIGAPPTQFLVFSVIITFEHETDDITTVSHSLTPWHYSPDGRKPPLIRFHSLIQCICGASG
jgi:hypothetical protein